jgi:hypothetical protein
MTDQTPQSTPRYEIDKDSLSESTCLLRQQKMVDTKVESVMDYCGGNTWCEIVLAKEQLSDYPASLLCFARGCRVILMFFIFFCVFGLMSAWLLEGSLTLVEEMDTKKELAVPSLALCPQPWGSEFSGDLTVTDANVVQIPGGKVSSQVEWNTATCPNDGGRMSGCKCIFLEDNLLHIHGKRGELEYFDYVRVTLGPLANAGGTKQLAFGFYAQGLVPQQWTYADVGQLVEGDLKLEEVATGKTEFSDGESTPRFVFRKTGATASADGRTTFVFGYDKYLSYVINSFASKYSFFAMMTVLITCCAAINNFGLFEIMFPEKAETAELQPNPCLQAVFAPMCACCRPVEDIEKALQTS